MSALKVAALLISIALGVITYQQVVSKVIHKNTQSDDLTSLWSSWKAENGKVYANAAEDAHRFGVFSENYALVQRVNSDPSYTYKLAMNKFADLTTEEFGATYASCHNGMELSGDGADARCPSAVNCPTLPEANWTNGWNWTTSGAVTGVKNQEQCGSCWAFSTTGSLEGLYFLNHSILLSFSEQQLVDCDTQCAGCSGCFPYLAMNYTAQYGIELESVYPYKGVNGTCQYTSVAAFKTNTGYQCVTQKSESQLLAALASQPVSIAVQASQAAWQLYSSGVVNKDCGIALDHAVLLTGYGVGPDGSNAYYVKNSWGTSWGMSGYIWLGTDAPLLNEGYGVCGILRCATLPTNN